MPKISIVEAVDPNEIAAVVHLLRDYQLWMRRRYQSRSDIVDAYFDDQEWQSELTDLSGHYGAPFGGIVLALVDGVPAGCVMLRGIGTRVSEMKRLFVLPAFAGQGLGKQLIARIMALSCERGYTSMHFEAGALQSEAEALYRSMGFAETSPYYACADVIRRTGRFYEAAPCAA